ncbi:MAG: sugar phosphate isomerase/epimerase [Planctomycetota bacterium]|nr:sugar phosphate isomerase/epimerase [Planctomycetota bacterium]
MSTDLKPVALQLYTLRERLGESKESFLATMKKVADIGYKGVEGGQGNAAAFGISVTEYKELLDDLGLQPVSGPGPQPGLSNIDELAETCGIFGVDVLMGGFGRDQFKDLDTIKATAETANRMVEAVKPHGLQLALHNHWWEFERVDGRIAQEYMAELCPGVFFELDVYWAANFGANDPAAEVAKFKDRIPLLHIKDGNLEPPSPDKPGGGDMTAVGQGKIDTPAAIAAASPDVLRWLIVELDRCETDMLEAVEDSYRYLTENGLGLGNV